MRAQTSLAFAAVLALASSPAASAPPHARVAGDATEEARIFSTQGVVLAATLRLPVRKGRHPVLIIQTGSGSNERGAYLTLQRRLVEAGIATLEFDKRGVGQSTGTFTDTMEDMETDLAAAIRWLRARGDVDGARIALLGHSQGAVAAPTVAERDGRLAAIVFLAGPVGERGTMFLDGMRAQLIGAGRAHRAVERVIAATRTWMEARGRAAPSAQIATARIALVAAFGRAGFTPEGAEGVTKVLGSPQLLSMYQAAPGAALARLRIPVLAILAARDEMVGASAPAAVAALAENPEALVVEVPGAGHVFSYRPADASPRVSPPGGRWLFPEALVVHWLTDRLVPVGSNGS